MRHARYAFHVRLKNSCEECEDENSESDALSKGDPRTAPRRRRPPAPLFTNLSNMQSLPSTALRVEQPRHMQPLNLPRGCARPGYYNLSMYSRTARYETTVCAHSLWVPTISCGAMYSARERPLTRKSMATMVFAEYK